MIVSSLGILVTLVLLPFAAASPVDTSPPVLATFDADDHPPPSLDAAVREEALRDADDHPPPSDDISSFRSGDDLFRTPPGSASDLNHIPAFPSDLGIDPRRPPPLPPVQALPVMAPQESYSTSTCSSAGALSKPALAYADCLQAIRDLTTPHWPGEEGPHGRPLDWYTVPRSMRVGQQQSRVVPVSYTHGQCTVRLGWPNNVVPAFPVRLSLYQVRSTAHSIVGQCIMHGRATVGERPLAGLLIRVIIDPSKAPAEAWKDRLRAWSARWRGSCCGGPTVR